MQATTSLRKMPVQGRSSATVACVLDAAAHILAEEGLAGLNTNAISRRAGVSIGSLYQYYPSKEAITSALILRAHETIVAGLRKLLSETKDLPWLEALDHMIGMLLPSDASSARLNRILEAEEDRLPKTAAILAAEAEIEAINREFFGRYINRSICTEAQLAVAAADVVVIVRALLDSRVDAGASLHDRLKRTICGYLEPHLRREDRCHPAL